MTAYTPTTLNYPQLADTPIRRVKQDHPPLQTLNFILGDEWLDTSAPLNGQWWKLDKAASGGLVWVRIGGGLGNVQGLTGNTGGEVGPDANANINVLGDTTTIEVVGTPSTHTLTISTGGSVATSYVEDTGTAVPAAGVLNVRGTANVITTTGVGNTITINAGAEIATTYTEDTGTATPAANNLNIVGGTGIHTSGAGSTVTISATGGAFTWSDESVSFAAVSNHGYFIVGNVTATLPGAPANGDEIAFIVDGAFTVTITGNAGQMIKVGPVTSAAAGTSVNTANGDTMYLVYRATDTTWEGGAFIGAWAVT